MKKITIAMACALTLLSGVVQAQEKLKIGFLSSMSGPLGGLASDMQDGFNLALKNNGNKLGGLDTEVIFGDDQQNPEVGKQIFDKMVQKDRVQFVTGTLFTNVVNAIAPISNREKVFLINPNNGPAPLAGEQCNPFYFNSGFQGETPAEAMGKYASARNLKNIYLIAPNFPAGQDNIRAFKSMYKGQVVGENFIKLGQLDFSVELSQIKAAKPDAVYVYLFGGMAVNFLKQYQQAGLPKELQLIGPGFAFDDDTIRAAGDAMVGSLNSWNWNRDLDNPVNKKFVADFQEAYKRPASLYAAQGFDAAMLIDAAIRNSNGKLGDKQKLQQSLKDSSFKSVRSDFKFGNNQNPIQTFYLRQIVKDDKGNIYNKIVSTLSQSHVDQYANQCKMK